MNSNKTNTFVYISLLCTVFCFAWSYQEKVLIQVKPQQVLELRQKAVECSEETGVPTDRLKKILETLPDDRPSKEFFYCVLYHTGYILENGLLNLEKMRVLTVVNGTQEMYVNDHTECNKLEMDDHVESAFAICSCFQHKYQFAILAQ